MSAPHFNPPFDSSWAHALQQQALQTEQLPHLQLEEDYELIHGTYNSHDFSGMDPSPPLPQQQQQQQQQSYSGPVTNASYPSMTFPFTQPNFTFSQPSNSYSAQPQSYRSRQQPPTSSSPSSQDMYRNLANFNPSAYNSTFLGADGFTQPQPHQHQQQQNPHQQHQHPQQPPQPSSHRQPHQQQSDPRRLSLTRGVLAPPFPASPGGYEAPEISISSTAKRRKQDEAGLSEGELDVEHEPEEAPMDEATGQNTRPKQSGACARCKNLKVRCEFKTDPDTCKRCLKGNHDCVIPGRKKRRAPPKREHLLNQIREQASQIEDLMVKLDHANRKANSNGSANTLLSPRVSISSPSTSSRERDRDTDLSSLSTGQDEDVPKPDVQAWIAKARESIQAFGGIIGGGAVMFVGDDPEDSVWSSSDDDVTTNAGNDEVHIAISDGGTVSDDARSRGSVSPAFRSREGSREGSPVRPGVLTGHRRLRSSGSASKLATIPGEASPIGLFAKLARKNKRRGGGGGGGSTSDIEEGEEVGLPNENFFEATPITPDRERTLSQQQQQIPHILTRGLVTPAESETLFKIYFDYMNISLSLLDPVLYTAQNTCGRSPFLFTVVCAIASRYYTAKPDLHGQLMNYARLAAGTALIGGPKTVELVHAYILLSLYPVPARRWEDDRGWIYLGMAIRVAMDLNLHRPSTIEPVNEQHAREILNRTRAWLNCFNLDRSTSSQYGKAPIIPNNDYLAVRSATWWNSSEYNMKLFDIHTCAYTAELRVMAEFRDKMHSDPDHPTGLNKNLDIETLAVETDDELVRLLKEWQTRIFNSDMTYVQNHFRYSLILLAYSYSRLLTLSFGLQQTFGKGRGEDASLLMRSMRAASDVVKVFLDDIGVPNQRIFLRHGPDAQRVFVTFASAFLIKLLHPKYASHFNLDQRLEMRNLVQRVIDLLGSPEVAIDDQHGPKLYSRFLKGLLATPMAQLNPSATLAPPQPERNHANPVYEQQQPMSEEQSPPVYLLDTLPPPKQPAMTFDQDPSASVAPSYGLGPDGSFDQNAIGLTTSRLFSPPLPFDNDLLVSMTNTTVWGETMLPGFNWMSEFHSPDGDVAMQTLDHRMLGGP